MEMKELKATIVMNAYSLTCLYNNPQNQLFISSSRGKHISKEAKRKTFTEQTDLVERNP